jgi:hypothetical protein
VLKAGSGWCYCRSLDLVPEFLLGRSALPVLQRPMVVAALFLGSTLCAHFHWHYHIFLCGCLCGNTEYCLGV